MKQDPNQIVGDEETVEFLLNERRREASLEHRTIRRALGEVCLDFVESDLVLPP